MSKRQLKRSATVAVAHEVVHVKPTRQASGRAALEPRYRSPSRPPSTPDHSEVSAVGQLTVHESHDERPHSQSPHSHHAPTKSTAAEDTARPPDFETPSSAHVYGEMVESKYAEAVCQRLRMSKRDVWRMRKQFNDVDVDNTNTITTTEFFFMLQIERCGLSKTMLRLADVGSDKTRLTFDEYLCCVSQFAAFSEPELLQFVFSLHMSDKKRGVLVEEDVMAVAGVLMTAHTAYKGNIRQASQRLNLHINGVDAMFTLADLQQLARQHRVAFYPLLSLQRSVRRATLGERYWTAKVEDSEKIEGIVHYMERHGGVTPPLSWQERLWAAVTWPRESRAARLRCAAEQKYTMK